MRRISALVLILTAAGCASTTDTPGVSNSSPTIGASLWKPGDASGYRYETRSESGTFAWIMDCEETVDGTTYYVLRAAR